MWTILRRALVPMLLVIGGTALVLYGVKVHLITVQEERATTTTVEVPMPFQQGPPPFPGGPPMGEPFPGEKPPMMKKTVTRVDKVEIYEHDPAITKDVTVGGVKLLASGEIQRTYDSSSGKGPALCPT